MVSYNEHVLKWMRYQHFMAVREHRQLGQLVWATEYERELAS